MYKTVLVMVAGVMRVSSRYCITVSLYHCIIGIYREGPPGGKGVRMILRIS